MSKSLQAYMKRAKELYELRELERLGLTPEMDQRHMILTFMALLLKWNNAAGLVSPKDEEILFLRHFCDSLQPLLLFGFKKNATVLDIGAGGGFPSIPICIFRPDLGFVLAESNRKKASFLKEVKESLELHSVDIYNGSVQRMKKPERNFDYVISRGVGGLEKVAELGKPFLAPDGRMYTFKTKQFSQELEAITTTKDKTGVRVNEIAEYDLGSLVSGFHLVSLELVR